MDNNLPEPEVFTSQPFSRKWKILLLLTVILLLLSLLINAYLYIFWQRQKTVISPKSEKLNLPFAVSDASVSMAGIAYKLQGTVWGVTQKEEGYEVILQGKDGKVYNNQPLLFKQTNLKTTLKANDSILLNYYFDLLKKIGYVTNVEIIK